MLSRIKKKMKKWLIRTGPRALPQMVEDWNNARPAAADGYSQWSTPEPIFTPWNGGEFEKEFSAIKDRTLVSRDRCYLINRFAQYAGHLNGAMAECGVYQGGTAYLLAERARTSSKKLFLFDSFKGLPAPAQSDNFCKEGDLSDVNELDVRNYLKKFEDIIQWKIGYMPQTFSGLEAEKFSFVHIDVDIYESAKACCEFFLPRLTTGGIMLFDDYGFLACMGLRKAVDEFFKDKKESVIALPTGQAFVIRRT